MREIDENLAGPRARMDTDAKERLHFISYDLNVASNMVFEPEKWEAALVILNISIVPVLHL